MRKHRRYANIYLHHSLGTFSLCSCAVMVPHHTPSTTYYYRLWINNFDSYHQSINQLIHLMGSLTCFCLISITVDIEYDTPREVIAAFIIAWSLVTGQSRECPPPSWCRKRRKLCTLWKPLLYLLIWQALWLWNKSSRQQFEHTCNDWTPTIAPTSSRGTTVLTAGRYMQVYYLSCGLCDLREASSRVLSWRNSLEPFCKQLLHSICNRHIRRNVFSPMLPLLGVAFTAFSSSYYSLETTSLLECRRQ